MAMHQPRAAAKQRGFVMLEIMAGLAIMIGIAMWAAYQSTQEVKETIAEATGRYMLNVRGAVLDLLSEQNAFLTGVDTSAFPAGTVAPAPAWLASAPTQTITVQQLKMLRADGSPGYLNTGFPELTQFGGEVRVRIDRAGTCPGASCRLDALVYSTVAEEDVRQISKAVQAADGYGGYSWRSEPDRIRGALFNLPNPQGSVAGILGVVASLDTTMFNQFVRQADTRHIYLNNQLTVAGQVTTSTGYAYDTNVSSGDVCAVEGLYAESARKSLAVCLGGTWMELTQYVVTGVAYDLRSGDAFLMPSCPSPRMEAFAKASLQGLDVTMTGTDVDVRGTLGGDIHGTGTVSKSGSVTVDGNFSGTLQSSPNSSVHVQQAVTVNGSQVSITAPGPNAKAMVVYGCRYL